MMATATQLDICRYMPQAERLKLWMAERGPIPSGMVLSANCRVSYCGFVEHMELREDKTAGWGNYTQYKKRVRALAPGESFEIPTPPNLLKFSSAMRAGMSQECFVIRQFPKTNTVRIIRTGSWQEQEAANAIAASIPVWAAMSERYMEMREKVEALSVREYLEIPIPDDDYVFRNVMNQGLKKAICVFRRQPNTDTLRIIRVGSVDNPEAAASVASEFPVLIHRQAAPVPSLRPGAFYLGFLWGCSEIFPPESIKKRCSVKACAFPAKGDGLCKQHLHFFDYAASPARGKVGLSDLITDSKFVLPTLTSMPSWEEPYSYKQTKFLHNGYVDRKREKLSDDYWEQAMAQAVRELEEGICYSELEQQKIDESKRQSAALAETALALDEAQRRDANAVENIQHTGAFVLWKGFGHKKVRKVQRMRPQGWHGNHPEQKPRKDWGREVLDHVAELSPAKRVRVVEAEEPEFDELEFELEEREEIAAHIPTYELPWHDEGDTMDVSDGFSWEAQ